MKIAFVMTSLIVLSALSFVPSTQAVATVDPCSDSPGYTRCAATAEPCAADVRYYHHDSFFTESAACRVGNFHCGYYSHSLYGEWTGFDCKFITPASASTDSGDAADCTQHPGYEVCEYGAAGACLVRVTHYYHDQIYAIEVLCDKAPVVIGGPPGAAAASNDEPIDCHGPLDGYQFCEVEFGKCHAGEQLWSGDLHAHAECQPHDGKSRCGVDVYFAPLEIWRHCGTTHEQVYPGGIAAGT